MTRQRTPEQKARRREFQRARLAAMTPEQRERYLARRRAHRVENKEHIAARRRVYLAANKEREAAKKRAYREANKERIAARRRVYLAANKERETARRRARWAANKERETARRRAHRAENKERIRAYYVANREREIARRRAYRAENKERLSVNQRLRRGQRLQQLLWRNARRRAQRLNIPFDLMLTDIVVPTHCPVFGLQLKIGEGQFVDNSPSLDRIIPEKGYVKGNVAVISMFANRVKSDATAAQLRRIAAWIDEQVAQQQQNEDSQPPASPAK